MGKADEVGGPSETMHIWRGDECYEEYRAAYQAAEGLTISPGGAAAILRMSRQAVWWLARSGHVRCWVLYASKGTRPMYAEFSIQDLLLWGFETGRLNRDSRVGFLLGDRVAELFDKWKAGEVALPG